MAAEPLPGVVGETCLGNRVRELCDEHADLWAATPAELPVPGRRVGFRRQFGNARAAARLIDELADEAERIPDGERERGLWRESVRARLQRFGELRLGWPAGYRRLAFGDAFFAASVAFAREARVFAPELPLDSLGQALRNVWIGNSLQMILGLSVTLNPSLFAYSMLYPLTDNLLDDPGVARSAKQAFHERFGRSLAGLGVSPDGVHEAAIFRLVERIDEEFPRRDFARVHESLLAIHRGQLHSLRQQDDPGLTDAEVVAISCEKGGSSVLADLYLVSGRATLTEERFAFGYGVFLQLLDDLQDIEEDLAAGHQTLFTRSARAGPLDEQAARLARFIDRVLDGADLLAGPELADQKGLVRRNCTTLLVDAVAEQPGRFSRRFRRALSRPWPVSLRAMHRLRRRAERRCRDAASGLQRRTGATSLLDLALRDA